MDFEGFLNKLSDSSHIVLTAPAGADGDSVGTQCAMRELILQKFPDKTVRIVNEDACPRRYQFLDQAQHFEMAQDCQDETPDVMICVDGGSPRIGPETTKLWEKTKLKAQIDHHALGSGESYDFRLYDPSAAATTQIVFRLVETCKLQLTRSIAQAIYVGLIFDTGMFKHSNTLPATLLIGAKLMATGFNHTETAERAMLIRSEGAFQMLKTVLSSVRFDLGGTYVWSVIDHASFLEAGGDADDREGLIDQVFLTEKCKIAALLFEPEPNQWKISFRARGFDVAKVAKSLNPMGGGHKLAAGCSMEGSVADDSARIAEAVRKELNA